MRRVKCFLLNMEQWKRNLYILFVGQLLSVVGFSVIFPFLPLYVEDLGVRTGGSIAFWSGLVFSAQAFTMAIMAPVWGTLADRMGRKMMVERALFGGAILLTLMGFVRSAEELTLLRAAQGAVTGVVTAANALVASSVPRERAGWALGLMQTSVWSGAAIGPLLGGVLADAVGFAATFKLTSVLVFVAGIAVHRGVVEGRDKAKEAEASRTSVVGSWKRTLTSAGLAELYSLKFLVRLAGTIFIPVAPLLVAALMSGSGRVATVAGLFTAATAAASTFSAIKLGSLGDRIGYWRVLMVGCLASGMAYLLFLWVHSVWQLIALAVVAGLANGAVIPNLGALLANASPDGGEGTTFGIDASVNATARMFAPLLGTAIASWFTLQASFAAAGVFFLLAGLLALFLVRSREVPTRFNRPVGVGD